MITTSDEYKNAIRADTEQIEFFGEFGFTPPGAVEGGLVESSSISPVGRLEQIHNGITQMSGKWATCETNRFCLDGSFNIVNPDDDSQQIGFISSNVCDTDGEFANKPYVDYILDADYSIIGITAYFDDKCNEFATSVTVTYYDSDDTVIVSETFENDKIIGVFDLLGDDVRKIRLTINSWNLGERLAKVVEVLPGQIFIFDSSNIYNFEYSASLNPFASSLTPPEFTINFDNSDQKFNIVNPKGLVAFLREKMMIKTKMLLRLPTGKEEINTGEFYVYSWPLNSDENTSSLTCCPSLAFMDGYYPKQNRGLQTVAEAVQLIFETAGVTENYSINADFEDIEVNQYIGDNVKLVDALAMLAVAVGGIWRVARDGSYNLDTILKEYHENEIDYDNAWKKPNIVQNKKISAVNVNNYIVHADDVKTVDNIVENTINDGSMIEIHSQFIASSQRAVAVGEIALEYYRQRLNFSTNFRGDMSMDVGEIATIEHDFGNSDVLILDYDFSFKNGILASSISGIGVETGGVGND